MTYKDELEVRLRRAENVLDRAKKRVKKWRRKLIRARAAHLYARQEVRRIRRELEAEIANIADIEACVNETSESAPSSPTPSCVEPKLCEDCEGARTQALADGEGWPIYILMCGVCAHAWTNVEWQSYEATSRTTASGPATGSEP